MSVLDYEVIITVPGSVPAQLQADWQSGLIAAGATKIKSRWDAIVGTSELWGSVVAATSNAQWQDFPNPAYTTKRGRSRDMLVGVQLTKLTKAFTKAKAAHDAMFAGGGANFATAVNAKAAEWSANVAPTLALTGDRLFGKRGPASIIARLVAGDRTYQRDTVGGVAPSGEPDPTRPSVGQVPYIYGPNHGAFKAAVEGKLIQVSILILQGYLTDTTQVNTDMDNMLKGFMHPDAAQPPTSFIHFSTAGGCTITVHMDNNDATP